MNCDAPSRSTHPFEVEETLILKPTIVWKSTLMININYLTLIRPPVVKGKDSPVTDFVKNPSSEAIQKTNSDLISN